jgi:hypothetical protein
MVPGGTVTGPGGSVSSPSAASGLLMARSWDRRSCWELSTLQFPMNAVYATAIDTRTTLYVFPLEADARRVPPDGACRVYRSDDARGVSARTR